MLNNRMQRTGIGRYRLLWSCRCSYVVAVVDPGVSLYPRLALFRRYFPAVFIFSKVTPSAVVFADDVGFTPLVFDDSNDVSNTPRVLRVEVRVFGCEDVIAEANHALHRNSRCPLYVRRFLLH